MREQARLSSRRAAIACLGVLLAVSVLASGVSLPAARAGSVPDAAIASSASGTIRVNGDAELALHASSGSGMPDDPYVIENKVIVPDLTDYYEFVFIGIRRVSFLAGVSIKNTNSAVLLRNITVNSDPVDVHERIIAFFLENNTRVSMEGLHAAVASNVSASCPLLLRGDPADLASPVHRGDYTITGSTFVNKAIDGPTSSTTEAAYLESLDMENVAITNTLWAPYRNGLTIVNTMAARLRGVHFTNSGLVLDAITGGTGGEDFLQGYDIDQSNTVDGLPILFVAGVDGMTISPPASYGQLIIIDSTNVLVAGIAISGGSNPVTVSRSTGVVISGVSITKGANDGITLALCSGITIENSRLFQNARSGVIVGGYLPSENDGPIIIRNNEISDQSRNVRLILASNVLVAGNTIFWTPDYLEWIRSFPELENFNEFYGIQVMTASNISILGNVIKDCAYAIETTQFYGAGPVSGLTIRDNKIIGSSDPLLADTFGINLMDAIDVDVSCNVIQGFDFGARVEGSVIAVYWNDFIDNVVNAWCNSLDAIFAKDGRGNYWSDYTSRYPDATSDGAVWDTPYEIEYDANDPFPLVRPTHVEENMLDEIAALVDQLGTLIRSNLPFGRRVACSAILARAIIVLDAMRAHDDPAGIPRCLPLVMRILVRAIDKIARDAAISACCDAIIQLLELV